MCTVEGVQCQIVENWNFNSVRELRAARTCSAGENVKFIPKTLQTHYRAPDRVWIDEIFRLFLCKKIIISSSSERRNVNSNKTHTHTNPSNAVKFPSWENIKKKFAIYTREASAKWRSAEHSSWVVTNGEREGECEIAKMTKNNNRAERSEEKRREEKIENCFIISNPLHAGTVYICARGGPNSTHSSSAKVQRTNSRLLEKYEKKIIIIKYYLNICCFSSLAEIFFRVLLFIFGLSLLFAWRKEWALPSRSAAEIQVRFLTNTRWTRRIGWELMIVSVLSQFSLFVSSSTQNSLVGLLRHIAMYLRVFKSLLYLAASMQVAF